ncbi:S8 family serine peptidase [[Brevibacterium] frigoritolerans]|nr:S8 family serine peptidase [Peribacillus frigoritolerans]
MKKFYWILLLVLSIMEVETNNIAKAENNKKGETLYGVILKETNKQNVKKSKKEIAKIYKVRHQFGDSKVLTVKSSDNLETVQKNLKKYGRVEILNAKYKLLTEGSDWNLELTKTDIARNDLGLDGSGYTVAVLDVGIDGSIPELKQKLKSKYDCTYDIACTQITIDTYENGNHGTNVAGLISTDSYGMAPGSKIIDFDLNEQETDTLNQENIYNALQKVKELSDNGEKIDVINMSFGSSELSVTMHTIISDLLSRGIILVAATGNYGDEGNEIKYPAGFEGVIAVGSVDKDKQIADSSSYGEHVSLVAPGVDVNTFDRVNGVATVSGTSFASPQVSGIATLYKQNYPAFSSNEIKNMIYENALDIGNPGKDIYYGYGLINSIPPKRYVINEKINISGNHKIYDFPNSNSLYTEKVIDQPLNATRAKGWNEEKKRFDWYYVLLGWIKAEDSLDGIEDARVSFTFNTNNITFYNTTDQNDIYRTIDIHSKRIGTHVTEQVSEQSTETGKYKWYKINLPEYGIENKWIYDPNGDMLQNPNPIKMNFVESFTSTDAYTFYDFYTMKTNPIVKTNLKGKKAIVTEGYSWDKTKQGFKWYKVSVPELGITDKWVEVYANDGKNIYQYGLMDSVAGRIVLADKVGNMGNNIIDNAGTAEEINPNGTVQFRFEKPVSVKNILINKTDEVIDPNFKLSLELLNENKDVLYTREITEDDYNKQILKLDREVSDVSFYRIKNIGTKNERLTEFEIFGSFEKTANDPKEVNFDFSFNETINYTFYDDPMTKANPIVKSNIRNLKATTTEGYYWVEAKQGFKWYKVSIPELGITDKWVEVYANDGKNIYQYGLMDNVAGRIVLADKVGNMGNNIIDNAGTAEEINPNGTVQFRFERPVSVKSILIKRYEKSLDSNFNLKLELFDEDGNLIYEKEISQDDYFEQFIKIEQEFSNVYSYKITNNGTKTERLTEFELFGSFEKTANDPQEVNFDFIFNETVNYTFYDDPMTKANPVVKSNIRNLKATTTEGYYWVEAKQGFKWYKVSIPELGITDKWVEVYANDGKNIYQYGLMDSVAGRIVFADKVGNMGNSIIGNSGSFEVINPNGIIEFTFDNPVSVKSIYIKKYEKTLNPNFNLVLELLDIDRNVIETRKIGQDDYFNQFIVLEQIKSGVAGYRLKNTGTIKEGITEFELFQ